MKLRILVLGTALLAATVASVSSAAAAGRLGRHGGGWHVGFADASWHPGGWGWGPVGLGLVPGAMIAPYDAWLSAAEHYGDYRGCGHGCGYGYGPSYGYGNPGDGHWR
jgi:hypothetical protein